MSYTVLKCMLEDHSGEDAVVGLLGFGDMWTCSLIPTSGRKILPLSSAFLVLKC